MSEDYITPLEFIILLGAGILLPWIIATIVQVRIYIKHGLSKWCVLASSSVTFLLTTVLGVVLWSTVPVLTIPWQLAVLRIPGGIGNILGFIPVIPMVTSTLIVAIPVTKLFLRRVTGA